MARDVERAARVPAHDVRRAELRVRAVQEAPAGGESGSTDGRGLLLAVKVLEPFGNVSGCLGGIQECLGRLEPQNS